MKHLNYFFSAVGILTVVGSALALTAKPYGQGSVYCNSTCTQRIDYRVANEGATNPCGGTVQEYVKISATLCLASSGPFEATAIGK
jgi:hypothetical protein